jgi:septum formation protein
MLHNNLRLILASASPRRVELLNCLCLQFEVIPSSVEEVVDTELPPAKIVTRLALEKAESVASAMREKNIAKGSRSTVVIGADTLVVCRGRVLGKPKSPSEAREMLSFLSAKEHEVHTGLALVSFNSLGEENNLTKSVVSKVCFRALAPEEIEAYLKTKEPMDKAGSYALQGTGAAFVRKIEGCYTNVIGLPVPDLVQMLRKVGVKVLGLPTGP